MLMLLAFDELNFLALYTCVSFVSFTYVLFDNGTLLAAFVLVALGERGRGCVGRRMTCEVETIIRIH